MSPKDKKLIIDALDLAHAELHTRIATCPDVFECATEIEELKSDQAKLMEIKSRLKAARQAPASGEVEPVYQLKSKFGGGWDDVTEDEYAHAPESYTRRTLYTQAQPAQQRSGEVEPVAEVVSGYSGDRDTINSKAIKPLNLQHCRIGTLLYPHPPAKVPEEVYAEAASVINAIFDCSQHCDCASFEVAKQWREETHGGDLWLDGDATPTPATIPQPPVQQEGE